MAVRLNGVPAGASRNSHGRARFISGTRYISGRIGRFWTMTNPTGQLATGTSAVELSTRLRSGELTVNAQEHTHGRDRTVIVSGRIGTNEIYRSFFSHDYDSTVFAVIADDGVTTRIALHDDSQRDNVGIVNVWNDGGQAQSFDVDIERFLASRDPEASIIATRGAPLDHVGARKPPAISAEEIADAFANTEEFRSFMRGAEHHERSASRDTGLATRGVNWKCAWICLVPACGLACLFWSPNRRAPAPKLAPIELVRINS
jgi:hypothetical protein